MTTRMNLRFRHEFILSMGGVYPSPKLTQEEAAMRVVSPLLSYSPVAEMCLSNVKDGCRRGDRLCIGRYPDATISNLSDLV